MPENLIRRPNGFYYVRVQVKGRDIWRSTRQTAPGRARKVAEDILSRLRAGPLVDDKKPIPTFHEWADTYEATYTPQKVAAREDRRTLERARRKFGHRPLTEIRRSHCQSYINDRLKLVAPGTVQREKGFLQAVFERAIEDGHLAQNPWRGIKVGSSSPRIRLLAEEDEPKLLAASIPRWQRWITFMLETGLRLSEARHVRPGDWQGDRLIVRKAAAKGKKAGTRQSRVVPLTERARKALEEQLAEDGHLWNASPDHYRDYLKRACRRAGIPVVSPHDLRHTFGTRAAKRGVPILVLSKVMGHSSVKVTERYYVHLDEEHVIGGFLDVVAKTVSDDPASSVTA